MISFKNIHRLELTPTQKLLLVNLSSHADSSMVCYPSRKRLADLTGVTVRTVSSILSVLCDKGYITRHNQSFENGAKTVNRYEINVSAIENAGVPVAKNKSKVVNIKQPAWDNKKQTFVTV